MMTFLKKKKEAGVPEDQARSAASPSGRLSMKIFTFDTTLRDGTQGEAVSFSVEDKLLIAQKLDELGIDYIEGGWPGVQSRRTRSSSRAPRDLKLKHARLTAFGSTRFAKQPGRGGPQRPRAGRSRHAGRLHLRQDLGPARPRAPWASPRKKTSTLISDTVRYLKEHGKEVVYDAEHFFDGYSANPDFALRTLEAAQEGRRRRALPVRHQRRHPDRPAGRDRRRGAQALRRHPRHPHPQRFRPGRRQHPRRRRAGRHARAGLHERLRRALRQRQPVLRHRQPGTEAGPHHHRPREARAASPRVARFIAELANLPLRNDQPYVGHSAFAHKGGMHVSAVLKDSATYEHITPETVGNRQRVLLSDLSRPRQHPLQAQAARPRRPPGRGRPPRTARAHQADGVPGLRTGSRRGHLRTAGPRGPAPRPALLRRGQLRSDHAHDRQPAARRPPPPSPCKAQDGVHSATATGHGPVNALDVCLRQCLSTLYPAHRRRPPDRLQGPRARHQEGHRRQGPRADRMVRPPPELGHGRRLATT